MKKWLAVSTLLTVMGQPVVAAEELVYSRLTEGFWQIWRQSEGGEAKQLTVSPSDKRHPVMAQDGTLVYHTHNNRVVRWHAGTEEEVLPDLWPVRDFVPSATGERAAFSRCRTDVVDQCNLWLLHLATNTRALLTHDAGIQYQPAWSPDGATIAYAAGAGPNTYEIFTIKADGTGQTQLTKNQANDFTPAWSPDGAHIVWSANVTGDYDIWVMQADGSEAKPLTQSAGLDARPAWSPDGTQIAWCANRAGRLAVWVMASDGSNQRPGVAGDAPTCDPSWH